MKWKIFKKKEQKSDAEGDKEKQDEAEIKENKPNEQPSQNPSTQPEPTQQSNTTDKGSKSGEKVTEESLPEKSKGNVDEEKPLPLEGTNRECPVCKTVNKRVIVWLPLNKEIHPLSHFGSTPLLGYQCSKCNNQYFDEKGEDS